jgi:nucleoside-triphosphatase THEP1
MFERMLQMQNRTNPLPPNYEERFAALETAVAEIKTSHGERLSSLERIVAALERSNREIVKELRMMREDYQTERNRRLLIEDCVDALERMAA